MHVAELWRENQASILFLLIKISYFCFVVPMQNNTQHPGTQAMNTFLLHLSLWISLSKWNSTFSLASEMHFEDAAFLFSYTIKTFGNEWIMFWFLQEAGDYADYFLLYYKEKCSFSYIMKFSETVDKKRLQKLI